MSFLNDILDDSLVADDPSLEVDSELNETRKSFFETPKKSSTPRKQVTPRKAGKNLFKEPRVPQKLFSCGKCHKKFRTENTLKKHLRSHVFKDAASQEISAESVGNAFNASIDPVLAEMIKDNSTEAFSNFICSFKEEHKSSVPLKKFKDCICSFLCESLVEKSFVLPSAMWGSLLCSVNIALNAADIRSTLKENLLIFKEDCSSEVCWPFVLEFTHKVAAAVLTMLTRSMALAAGVKVPEEREARSTDDFKTDWDKTTAFHIFGFVVKHFWVKALNASKSIYWKKILDTISTRFVKGGLVSTCSESIELWTASIDRGSLTYVGENAFNFFIALAPILQCMEERDGSLGHEAVLVKVFQTPALLLLWDTVIGNTLDEDCSITFLTSVVKSVSNVMGVGIRDRRLNEVMSKGSVNVGLRGSLGPKQSVGSLES